MLEFLVYRSWMTVAKMLIDSFVFKICHNFKFYLVSIKLVSWYTCDHSFISLSCEYIYVRISLVLFSCIFSSQINAILIPHLVASTLPSFQWRKLLLCANNVIVWKSLYYATNENWSHTFFTVVTLWNRKFICIIIIDR